MIEHIRGKFVEKKPTHFVVEAGGIGYMVQVSLNTYTALQNESEGSLMCHYTVSVDVRSGESRHQLFGFATEQERQLFRHLITVSGVSSGIAHTILSSFNPGDLSSILANADSKSLTSVKGVGPKLAQKIISELQEKIHKTTFEGEKSETGGNSLRQEALSALTALGFDRSKSVKVINEVVKNSSPKSVEDLIKLALKQL